MLITDIICLLYADLVVYNLQFMGDVAYSTHVLFM